MEQLSHGSVDPAEIAKFSRLAEEWWDPNGKFRPLHVFNPVRIGFVRDIVAGHFGRDPKALRPFSGLTLLDIGCGGGLLSEPMARQGFDVLGADASERNIAIATRHAESSGVPVRYRATTAEALAAEGAQFNVVLNMEVVEHVADVPAYIRASAELVAPGGLMITATINRTLKSLALAKIGAEYILRWVPAGTHDWDRFLRPEELEKHLSDAGLQVEHHQGIVFDPLRWEWQLSKDTDVNYMIVAIRQR